MTTVSTEAVMSDFLSFSVLKTVLSTSNLIQGEQKTYLLGFITCN